MTHLGSLLPSRCLAKSQASLLLPAVSLLLLLAADNARAGQWSHDFESAQAQAQATGKPMLLHFSATYCGPCRRMEAETLHRGEVARLLDDCVGVLIDVQQRKDLMNRYGIKTIPTDVVVDAGGREVYRRKSFATASAYRNELAGVMQRATPRPAPQQVVPERTRPLLAGQNEQPKAAPQAMPRETASTNPPARTRARIPMVKGYSVVALHERREWTKGSPDFAAEHRGQLYWFSDEVEKQQFLQRPRRYTPRLLGCDAVIFEQEDRATMGSVNFAAFYGDDLFLFVSDEQRRVFKTMPEQYLHNRVVTLDEIESVTR